ncbi:uncharacterized protein RSE6_14494 [Rhynchosporium secalis]|uniref:Uncharacterized protein n=1 Tax=Rhynchosporium secalis TaxID=38038 RepID=A0A1E1MVG5_RHYSE|nr:uncharacterized protein RSE6_14494 [Rhynchosporium secalis]
MASTSTSLIGELVEPSSWDEDVKLNMDNSHIWSHRVGLMLRHHKLNKYIRLKAFADTIVTPSEEDVKNLSLASSYIQQTMSLPLLALLVDGDDTVLHDSQKLWKKIADSDLLIPKGRAAFLRFHIRLSNLHLKDFVEPADFVSKSLEIQKLRAATGVPLTDDLENIAALVRNLPRELEDLGLKWRLSDYEGLTAAEAAAQIKAAQEEFDKLPREEKPRDIRRPDHREPRREPRRENWRRRGGERRGSERRSDGRRGARR